LEFFEAGYVGRWAQNILLPIVSQGGL